MSRAQGRPSTRHERRTRSERGSVTTERAAHLHHLAQMRAIHAGVAGGPLSSSRRTDPLVPASSSPPPSGRGRAHVRLPTTGCLPRQKPRPMIDPAPFVRGCVCTDQASSFVASSTFASISGTWRTMFLAWL